MEVETTRGVARVHLDEPEGSAGAALVLGHGAGGGVDAVDLVSVRDRAVASGLRVARVEQPYRVAGRRAPPPATHLDDAWRTVIDALHAWFSGLPLLVGGRSSGARVACRTAAAVEACGVVALAFPLHPPGRPERSRAAELLTGGIPVLAVNGERDPFGVPEPSDRVTVTAVPGEKHALNKNPGAVADIVARWLASFRPPGSG